MADSFQAYKVASNEQSSSTKFDNFVQAVENAINSLDNGNISASAGIAVNKLAPGSNGDIITTSGGVATWTASTFGSLVTALPASPVNAQQIVLVDSLTAPTYAWSFRYISAKASNKWQFVGGSPKIVEVATSETTTSTVYVALATAGPSIALPVAGDYLVEIGAKLQPSAVSTTARMSYDIGATGAVDADALEGGWGTAGDPPMVNGTFRRAKLGLTAVTLTAKYRNSSATTSTFAKRWMSVTPIAVGG